MDLAGVSQRVGAGGTPGPFDACADHVPAGLQRARPLPDQRHYWDTWHRAHDHASHMAHAEATLAHFVGALAETPADLPGGAQNGRASRVLELGCGQGRDAIALAQAGHEVTALDHSSVAINRATAIACHELPITWNLTDYVAGVRSCESATFDGVYSHLSLHYLSDNDTHELFDEIARVLKPGGLLLFTVRATDDPLHGRGDEIDAKRFLHRGHVRHFFEETYVRALLSKWHEVDVHHYDTARQTTNPGVFYRVRARRALPE